ncbi:hypothetical protein GBF38_018182 [Nibea albiflora]|uniref:Uncharacterized protein n=1 Tax=Nibea albiflora TaxID=240163 RepID=A0ACB7EGL3_NIBAL|nr:hypothetical protein GBF38_018182 [Nibea albiflora]
MVDVCSPKAVESLELNVSLSSVGGWVFGQAGRQGDKVAPPGAVVVEKEEEEKEGGGGEGARPSTAGLARCQAA